MTQLRQNKFPADDPVGAFAPHSPPLIKGAGTGPLTGLGFAVKDFFDISVFATSTESGNPILRIRNLYLPCSSINWT